MGKQGCFADPRFAEFISMSCVTLAERNQCMIRTMYCDDVPVASQLLFMDDRGSYMYQSGRDPSRDNDNVGRLLNLSTIESMHNRGQQFLDYLRGDEIYKGRMGAEPTKLTQVRIVAPCARNQMQFASGMFGRNVKRIVKRIVKATGIGTNVTADA